jgi:hypothetical protein
MPDASAPLGSTGRLAFQRARLYHTTLGASSGWKLRRGPTIQGQIVVISGRLRRVPAAGIGRREASVANRLACI